MFKLPLLLDTDSYKASHWKQYPPETTGNYAYFEARTGSDYSHTLFFGLQYILQEYLSQPITQTDIDAAKQIFEAHGEPFNYAGWQRIVDVHGGRLPLRIKAVKEGSLIPISNVLMTVESTDKSLAWVTSYIETILSRLWYPCTVATRSYTCRQIIYDFLKKTSDNPDQEINFKLHDFGSRGCTSQEQAGIGGAAHLLNFSGTDTVVALPFLNQYYKAFTMPGFSIPAAEHSTITAWGRDGEIAAYRNILRQYGSGTLVAVVSDSYDIYNAAENLWGTALKQDVLDMNATLVIRPDSGDPVEVVNKVTHILADKFGYETNSKGYKVLKKVRVIQGDGMDQEQIRKCYRKLYEEGFAADNLAVGMGAGLLQKLNRDTCRFAYKTSWMEINGESVDIYKDPVTDKGKKSKRGRLSLIKNIDNNNNSIYQTVPETPYGDILELVFENGIVKRTQTLEEIRALVRS